MAAFQKLEERRTVTQGRWRPFHPFVSQGGSGSMKGKKLHHDHEAEDMIGQWHVEGNVTLSVGEVFGSYQYVMNNSPAYQ